jgi:hypothetical protein
VNFSFRTAAKLANALRMDFMPELRPQEEKASDVAGTQGEKDERALLDFA